MLLPLILSIPCFADAKIRGESLERRDLRAKLSNGYGGAAGREGVKTGVMRQPLVFPPPELPMPLSDHTATNWKGEIYIAGGCDSPNGNEFDPNNGFFACSSLSEKFFSYDPKRYFDHFTFLPNLPRERYRHSSAASNDQMWLVGGRDVDDNLIDTVDVFDVNTKSFQSFSLPAEYQVSDHASFVNSGFIYIAGGYDQFYNAKSMVYRIDTVLSSESLVIEEVDPLLTPRGDAVATQDSNYAYVAGGYTDTSCEALGVVERYEFASGQWQSMPSLSDARGNFGMVQLGNIFIVLGGETGVEDACVDPSTDPAEALVAVDSAEVLGPNSWVHLGPQLGDHRFRFAAVAWGATGTIYTIGGQKTYDASCQCYPSSSEIVGYTRLYNDARAVVATPAPTKQPSPAPIAPPPILPPSDAPDVVINDLCENAMELEALAAGLGRFSVAYGNTEEATEDFAPSCGSAATVTNDQPGVWFFVRGTEGVMTAKTCHEYTNYDTKLSVYEGSCGGLQCVEANDDGCGIDSKKSSVSWVAQRDNIYYILVHGWQTGKRIQRFVTDKSMFKLKLKLFFVSDPVGNFAVWCQAREPPNDRCAWAQGPLAVGDSVDGTSLYANLNFDESGAQGQTCGGAYGNVEGVWYYTVGTGKVMTADTCDERTVYDTKIHIFTGDCQKEGDSKSLTCLKGNDNNVECGSLVSRKSKVYW